MHGQIRGRQAADPTLMGSLELSSTTWFYVGGGRMPNEGIITHSGLLPRSRPNVKDFVTVHHIQLQY